MKALSRFQTWSCPVLPVLVMALACSSPLAHAQEAPASEAVTTKDPEIPVDELRLRLKPLTRAELEIEAEAWLRILQRKIKEISDAEILKKRKDAEIKKVEKLADAAETATGALAEAQRALEEARKSNDPEAVKEAEDRVKEAQEKVDEARQASQAAEAEEKKAEEDADIKKVEEETLKEVQEKKAEGAQAEGAQAGEESPAEATATGGARPDEDSTPDAPAEGQISDEAPAVAATGEGDAEKLKETAEAAKAAAEAKSEVKVGVLEKLNRLRDERTALVERVDVVLEALEAKGGDVESFRQYVQAVGGGAIIEIDMDAVSGFDWTAIWIPVKGWLTSPTGGIRWAMSLGQFLGIIIIAVFLARLLGKVTDRALRASMRTSALLSEFLGKAVRRTVIFVGLIVSLRALNIDTTPVLAAIGAAGLVIGLALQGTLSNFASGILILMYRPFDVGDVIEAAGIAGKVESMNLVSTKIKTFDNKAMVVPNNKIWGDVITNATSTDKRRVDMVFGIGYADDIEKAQAILEDIVGRHELVLADPAPTIKLNELGDSSVNFICRPWAKTADLWTVYWDVTRAVKQEFDRQGISIPFPQRDVHVYHETPAPQGSGV